MDCNTECTHGTLLPELPDPCPFCLYRHQWEQLQQQQQNSMNNNSTVDSSSPQTVPLEQSVNNNLVVASPEPSPLVVQQQQRQRPQFRGNVTCDCSCGRRTNPKPRGLPSVPSSPPHLLHPVVSSDVLEGREATDAEVAAAAAVLTALQTQEEQS